MQARSMRNETPQSSSENSVVLLSFRRITKVIKFLKMNVSLLCFKHHNFMIRFTSPHHKKLPIKQMFWLQFGLYILHWNIVNIKTTATLLNQTACFT